MPMFTTMIRLEDGNSSEYALIRNILKRKFFVTKTNKRKEKILFSGIHSDGDSFIKQGEFPQIVNDVLNAIKKTGKSFSFTVVRTHQK